MAEDASRLVVVGGPVRSRAGGSSIAPERRERDALRRLMGVSAHMERVRGLVRSVARSHVPVLILGETGTGKELCAEAIATYSRRRPFIVVNCAELSEGLVESELFGHEKGAFTGAIRSRVGLIESADGGTLFLDELADVPRSVQAKLLRTLDTGEFRRVGSNAARRSEFRIITATNADVDEGVAGGRLREDLLHRVRAVHIMMPALRDRVEDIPTLSEEFLGQYRSTANMGPTTIAPQACAILMQESWPGNARQLRNVVEAAAALAGSETEIGVVHVLQALPSADEARARAPAIVPLAEVRRRAERRAILEALQLTGGSRERAARLLHISPATLYRKLGSRPR